VGGRVHDSTSMVTTAPVLADELGQQRGVEAVPAPTSNTRYPGRTSIWSSIIATTVGADAQLNTTPSVRVW
jgi:hypothetical protein